MHFFFSMTQKFKNGNTSLLETLKIGKDLIETKPWKEVLLFLNRKNKNKKKQKTKTLFPQIKDEVLFYLNILQEFGDENMKLLKLTEANNQFQEIYLILENGQKTYPNEFWISQTKVKSFILNFFPFDFHLFI